MMKIFYFTGTGNSLYVAQQLGGELLSIPQVMKDDRIEIQDEAVGIVCPIYAGDMPKMVQRFLEKAKIETDYFFMVYTYGMDATVATPHASEAAEKAGIRLDYVAQIKWWTTIFQAFHGRAEKNGPGKEDPGAD